jgi:mono/diheme cytochrome c family protein
MKSTMIPLWLRFTLAVSVILAWPLAVAAQESPPTPADASAIFQARCANCHGATGQGDGPQAQAVGLTMPDLSAPSVMRNTTPERWFDIISNGVTGEAMPPFGDASSNPISVAERWNLVYLLYTLGTTPEQVAMGQALYAQSCTSCHGSDGAGTDGAPGFTDLAVMAQRSQADLVATMTDPAITAHSFDLGEVEMWTLADYVRTFSYNYAAPAGAAAAPTGETGAETPASSPFTGGEGVVTGKIINGTPGAAAPGDVEITLRAFDMNAAYVDEITTTVAADGAFQFDGIDVATPVQMEPLVVYEGVSYFGDLGAPITLSPEQPQMDVPVTVYETTQDPSHVYIERLHVVFDMATDRAQVAELYILSNDGDRSYVGTPEEGTLQLSVPSDALSFQPGGDPNRFIPLADGLADTTPVAPGRGTAQSVLVYTLPYDDGLDLSRPMPFRAQSVNVFVPADVGLKVSGEGLQPGGPFQTQGMTLDTYQLDNLAAGDDLIVHLSGKFTGTSNSAAGAGSPHQAPGPNGTVGIAVGLFSIAGVVVFGYLYWQGHLNLNLRPAPQDRQMTLLQKLADLDDDYNSGAVQEKPYRTARARLKQELLTLMEDEK